MLDTKKIWVDVFFLDLTCIFSKKTRYFLVFLWFFMENLYMMGPKKRFDDFFFRKPLDFFLRIHNLKINLYSVWTYYGLVAYERMQVICTSISPDLYGLEGVIMYRSTLPP